MWTYLAQILFVTITVTGAMRKKELSLVDYSKGIQLEENVWFWALCLLHFLPFSLYCIFYQITKCFFPIMFWRTVRNINLMRSTHATIQNKDCGNCPLRGTHQVSWPVGKGCDVHCKFSSGWTNTPDHLSRTAMIFLYSALQ